jgi:hypothetical protein
LICRNSYDKWIIFHVTSALGISMDNAPCLHSRLYGLPTPVHGISTSKNKNMVYLLIFEVFTVVTMKIIVVWDMMLYGFGGTC